MVYQYNKLTKNTEEVILPATTKLRPQQWVDMMNASSKESNGNCFYSTEILMDEEAGVTHDEMEEFFNQNQHEEVV